MADPKVRREIALRAAQLMYARECSEYFTAKRKAAKQVAGSDRDLPSNAEIRDNILVLAQMLEGDKRTTELAAMRLEALRMLRMLEGFKTRLIGSVLTGHVRCGSDIDLHVFSDSTSAVTDTLESAGLDFAVEHKRVLKHHEERIFTHIHVRARFPVEITLYTADKSNYPFKSSITGKTMVRADARALEALLNETVPGIDIEAELTQCAEPPDPSELFLMLLRPLEAVKQNPLYHPEGDALYHSLQVFSLAREERPWDQEFVLAALLHDVGKAIDRSDHVGAAISALEGAISERTAWLIAHHMDAHACRDGTIGARARRRLEASPDFEDLLLLAELDRAGRTPGRQVPSVEEAVVWLRSQDE